MEHKYEENTINNKMLYRIDDCYIERNFNTGRKGEHLVMRWWVQLT